MTLLFDESLTEIKKVWKKVDRHMYRHDLGCGCDECEKIDELFVLYNGLNYILKRLETVEK